MPKTIHTIHKLYIQTQSDKEQIKAMRDDEKGWSELFQTEPDEQLRGQNWSEIFTIETDEEEVFTGQQLIAKIEEIFLIDNKEQTNNEQRINILKTTTWWGTQSRQAQQHPKEAGTHPTLDGLF
jgi:hypothetical protein